MKALVKNIGTRAARLSVEGLAPPYITVPLTLLPPGVEKGETLDMTFSRDGEEEARAEETSTEGMPWNGQKGG